MRCILCDRCKQIVEDERKIKVVTYARPLNTGSNIKCTPRADDRQMSEQIWTKELCAACAEALEDFMSLEEAPDGGDSSGDTDDTVE